MKGWFYQASLWAHIFSVHSVSINCHLCPTLYHGLQWSNTRMIYRFKFFCPWQNQHVRSVDILSECWETTQHVQSKNMSNRQKQIFKLKYVITLLTECMQMMTSQGWDVLYYDTTEFRIIIDHCKDHRRCDMRTTATLIIIEYRQTRYLNDTGKSSSNASFRFCKSASLFVDILPQLDSCSSPGTSFQCFHLRDCTFIDKQCCLRIVISVRKHFEAAQGLMCGTGGKLLCRILPSCLGLPAGTLTDAVFRILYWPARNSVMMIMCQAAWQCQNKLK